MCTGCLVYSEENLDSAHRGPRFRCHEFQMHVSLQWRHNEPDGLSNHQPHDCLLNRLFGRRSKKTSKLRVTGLCEGNSPGTGEFPSQTASNAENVSIWWRHHDLTANVSSGLKFHRLDQKGPMEDNKTRIILFWWWGNFLSYLWIFYLRNCHTIEVLPLN